MEEGHAASVDGSAAPSGSGIMHACQSALHPLSQGGKVTMPLAPAFWSKTFGMLTDRFGVNWAVNGEPIPMG